MKKIFDQPISLRSRDHRVAALVRKGHTTDDELFAAQYGEWPVRGLDKDTLRERTVNFRKFTWDITTVAYIRDDEPERNIYLNRLLLSPLGHGLGFASTKQAYARLHDFIDVIEPELLGPRFGVMMLVASFFSSYRYAAASSMVKLLTPSMADEVGQEHIHLMQHKDGDRSMAQAAFQAAADDYLNNSKPLERARVSAMQAVDMLLTWMPRAYYSSDHELQARLHNIMVRGYPAWGTLPRNKDELWAAMHDMGILSPLDNKSFNQWLAQEEHQSIRVAFKKHAQIIGAYFHPPSAEMNIGLNATRSGKVLRDYWVDFLPLAYGDLLVKYGDSQGRAKMGFADESDILGLPTRQQPPKNTLG